MPYKLKLYFFMSLSNIFKFTQGLGQAGHQIGRKVGDAIELLVYAMIKRQENLSENLIVEDGVEGATGAKHKVEFSFYDIIDNEKKLFGIIECKKVGVEQTIKQNFKAWGNKNSDFYTTEGYSFIMSPSTRGFKWLIEITPLSEIDVNLNVRVTKVDGNNVDVIFNNDCNFSSSGQILFVSDVNNDFHVLGLGNNLNDVEPIIRKCVIVQISSISDGNITRIHVNEALPGPQTPEKAKQASFVSLDVRKKVLGTFDKNEDKSFISVLVIGEAVHWEKKSRDMITLCNDYNLEIPDEVIVDVFDIFLKEFGNEYQKLITKSEYLRNQKVKDAIETVLNKYNYKILRDLHTGEFCDIRLENNNNKKYLRIIPFEG